MKTLRYYHPALWILSACLLLTTFTPVQAKNPEHLDEQFITLSGYLDQGEYERGIVLLDLILDAFGPTAREELGPSFGRFFYLKGLFLLAMERYEEAARNFVICYRSFPNHRGQTNFKPNPFTDEAMVRHISCLMALERYDEAAPLFNLVNRAGLENMSDNWALSINRGLAMIRSGSVQEGVAFLKDILENTDNPNITPSMRMEVIQLLVFHWSGLATMDEVRSFATTIRPFIAGSTVSDRRSANPFFLDAARKAFDAKDFDRCLLWIGFFDFTEALAETKENTEPSETEVLSQSEEVLSSYLALTAAVYLQLDNPLGAVPAFDVLTKQFPQHAQTAEYRYNLALSQVAVGMLPEALQIARSFRDDFPDSPLASNLESTLLELLLANNEIDSAISQAQQILARETEDSATETAAYVLGIGFYIRERIEEAEAAFDAYVTRFENGEHMENVLYYRAACKYQLAKFDEAVTALEDLVQKHSGGDLISAALLLQAQAFLQIEKNAEAISRLQKIGEDYPESPEATEANLLAAQLMADSGAPDTQVREAYERTREAALMSNDRRTADEALKQILLLAISSGDVDRTSETYDRFFTEATYTPGDALEIITASWELLYQAGRRQELLRQIETLLMESGTDRHSPVLLPLVDSYKTLLGHPPVDFSPLMELSESPNTPQTLSASLLLARIDLLEEDKQWERDQLYSELSRRIPREKMDSYVLIRLSRWYQQSGDSATASEIRDSLLETRGNEPGFEYVLLDAALLQAESGDPNIRNSALEMFEQVAERSEDPQLLEQTRLGIARIHSRNEEWEKAKTAWGSYLSNRKWILARAEANFEFARSIEESGDPRQALGYYVSVYSNFEQQLDWSSRAYLRAALIMDAQGKRREALLILQDMLRRMHEYNHPVVDHARTLFNQWKDEFTRSN